MKSTGIVRPLDKVGRVTIPLDLRRQRHLPEGTPMEILISDETDDIILRPFRQGCIFCGEADQTKLTDHEGRKVCDVCRDKLSPNEAVAVVA